MQTKEIDTYEEKLQKSINILKECQQSLSLKSCFNCDKLLNCKTRESYIESVYNSMNRGKSGGFEF
jgi:hypothetical protein